MKSSPSSSPARYTLLVAGGLCLAGALAGTVLKAEHADPSHSVAVQFDDHAVNRGALEPASFADVAKHVAPCVVKITVRMHGDDDDSSGLTGPNGQDFNQLPDPFRQFFGFGPMMRPAHPQPVEGLGSGVIISHDGYIVTNNHVVDHADHVEVTLSDGRVLHAKVVGRDPQTDVAVIKVDAKDLPAITFADSGKIEVGDRVLAVGNPFGIGETVTTGIVSATGRQVGILDNVHGLEDFIQTDAAINPGNSGGALVDVQGRLIGINSAIYSRSGGFQGVGFAVPSDLVRTIAVSLVATGKVTHGHIGVMVQPLTPALASSFGVSPNATGALVSEVEPGSPAQRAGLQSGDVITQVDGKPIKDADELRLAVGETTAGTRLQLSILRDGKPRDLTVTTNDIAQSANGDQDQNAVAGDDKGVLNGVAVGDLDDQARQQFNIPDQVRGALITDVAGNSASALAGLQPGDVILEINHHRVTDADQAVKLSENSGNKKTLLKLWSHGGMIYTLVDESGDAAS